VIDVVDPHNATGISTMTLYRSFGSSTLPLAIIDPEMIAEYHDRFVLTGDGWRIDERRAVVVFRLPGTTH
jgi:hypothetical protein